MTALPPGNSVYRILDAGINRAGEGLRVVEDYLRMVLDDAHLSLKAKQLRHDLTMAVSSIDTDNRIAARDSESDVGRYLQTTSEYTRESAISGDRSNAPLLPDAANIDTEPACAVVQANLSRVQQSFRSIEEFSKSIDAELAKQIEQLRYQTYTLEKAVLTTLLSLRNLANANLYVLLDAGETFRQSGEMTSFLNKVERLAEAGVNLIQLREKNCDDRQLVQLGRAVIGLLRNRSTRFIMNDRIDLAMACGADGVHLGQNDLPVSDARRILGARRLVGVSTHSLEQARQAVMSGADYIGVGPVFPSGTKSFRDHVGTGLLKKVAGEIQLPAYAIGGIDGNNLASVLEAGFSRIAVSGAVSRASDPVDTIASLFRQLPPTTL